MDSSNKMDSESDRVISLVVALESICEESSVWKSKRDYTWTGGAIDGGRNGLKISRHAH